MSKSSSNITSDNRIYLDYNSTTPLEPVVLQEIHSVLKDAWGNPNSNHEPGKLARGIIDKARESVAKMINANSEDIIFTSGGTESNNWVIQSAVSHFHTCRRLGLMCQEDNEHIFKLARALKSSRPHIITSAIEHDSINMLLGHMSDDNKIAVTWLNVSPETGLIDIEELIASIKPSTCLVSIMYANNETGVIQPITKIVEAIKKYNEENKALHLFPVLFHTDAAQSIGKIPVNVKASGMDYMTIVGHKYYGPRIGALYIKSLDTNTPLYPLLYGGGQERNFRPGTENTAMIAGLGKASDLVSQNVLRYQDSMKTIRDVFELSLKKKFGDKIVFNGKYKDDTPRIPNTTNFSFVGENFQGHKVLSMVKKFNASVGSACHSQLRPSSILLSMGIPEDIAANAIRISFGRTNSVTDSNEVIAELARVIKLIENE